jgi:hypothetical protein
MLSRKAFYPMCAPYPSSKTSMPFDRLKVQKREGRRTEKMTQIYIYVETKTTKETRKNPHKSNNILIFLQRFSIQLSKKIIISSRIFMYR